MSIFCYFIEHHWKAVKVRHGFAWVCTRCNAFDENEN